MRRVLHYFFIFVLLSYVFLLTGCNASVSQNKIEKMIIESVNERYDGSLSISSCSESTDKGLEIDSIEGVDAEDVTVTLYDFKGTFTYTYIAKTYKTEVYGCFALLNYKSKNSVEEIFVNVDSSTTLSVYEENIVKGEFEAYYFGG